MNVLQQERFSRLQFPVHKITAKTPEELFQVLPGLRRYFQKLIQVEIQPTLGIPPIPHGNKVEGYEACWRGTYPEDLVCAIKYIVFAYDPDSDLIGEYSEDLKMLKDAAAKEAGFKRLKDGEWPTYVQDILDFKEKQVVTWIIDFLKIKKSPIWMEMKFLEEEVGLLYRQRTNSLVGGSVKNDSMSLIQARMESLEVLKKRFYAEHTDLKKASEEELFPVTPENIYKEMKIPAEVYKVRQVRDVPKATGIDEVRNQ